MKIKILPAARRDLTDGFWFYENQAVGIGTYFLDTLYSDIESLLVNAGIHPIHFDYYQRLLSKRFPFAIYYRVEDQTISVYAILDCRRNPVSIKKRLS